MGKISVQPAGLRSVAQRISKAGDGVAVVRGNAHSTFAADPGPALAAAFDAASRSIGQAFSETIDAINGVSTALRGAADAYQAADTNGADTMTAVQPSVAALQSGNLAQVPGGG